MNQFMKKTHTQRRTSSRYYILYFYCFIKLYLMAKRRLLTKGQIYTRNVCIVFALTIFLVFLGANLIISNEFGIFLQFGAPDHDSPMSCAQDESLECTTKEGKCTKDQDKCVYPESSEECSSLMYTKNLSNNKRRSLKSLYTNEKILMEKTKIFEQYCSTQMVNLYTAMTDDLIILTAVFELLLSAVLFGLFFSEITQVSHNLVYN